MEENIHQEPLVIFADNMAFNASLARLTFRNKMELQKRKNRTLVESAWCVLQHARLSNVFWAEAVNTAVYVLNQAPTSIVKGKTPQEAWSGKKPTVEHFRVFGSNAYAYVLDEKRTKLRF